jgi:hypothetical protein
MSHWTLSCQRPHARRGPCPASRTQVPTVTASRSSHAGKRPAAPRAPCARTRRVTPAVCCSTTATAGASLRSRTRSWPCVSRPMAGAIARGCEAAVPTRSGVPSTRQQPRGSRATRPCGAPAIALQGRWPWRPPGPPRGLPGGAVSGPRQTSGGGGLPALTPPAPSGRRSVAVGQPSASGRGRDGWRLGRAPALLRRLGRLHASARPGSAQSRPAQHAAHRAHAPDVPDTPHASGPSDERRFESDAEARHRHGRIRQA